MLNFITSFLLLFSFSAQAQPPEMKGGLPNFFKSNIIYPNYSRQNCIQGAVDVGFKLNAKGEVYFSTINKGMGTDLDDEALRLIRLTSGKWIMPSTHDSLVLLVVKVNFSLQGFECVSKDKREIAQAIAAYRAEEELASVVINFYKNKEKGSFKAEDEAKILRIKNELEITDEYLANKIESGLKKIKQGDKQGACEDFNFVKYMGSDAANELLAKYCK
jgi:TonB family protein